MCHYRLLASSGRTFQSFTTEGSPKELLLAAQGSGENQGDDWGMMWGGDQCMPFQCGMSSISCFANKFGLRRCKSLQLQVWSRGLMEMLLIQWTRNVYTFLLVWWMASKFLSSICWILEVLHFRFRIRQKRKRQHMDTLSFLWHVWVLLLVGIPVVLAILPVFLASYTSRFS